MSEPKACYGPLFAYTELCLDSTDNGLRLSRAAQCGKILGLYHSVSVLVFVSAHTQSLTCPSVWFIIYYSQ